MAKAQGQKLKLLYLMQIFMEQTDEEHGLTLQELADRLKERGVAAERKSLYDDMEALRSYGLDIIKIRRRDTVYCLAGRSFELPELKLLVDAIQSSRFITARKSRELIGKIESLTSRYHAQDLQRQVFVAGRIKTMNESIYYNIDTLHAAISEKKQISFLYFEWAVDFAGGSRVRRRYRRGGARYQVSPWGLIWADENYYLVAYDGAAGIIKHYRVDKMSSLQVEDAPRDGQQQFAQFDTAAYSRRMFGMYGGEEVQVKLRFANRLIGVVVDRFGRDVMLMPADDDHFCVLAQVAVSPQFCSWVFGFGDEAQILGPEPVVRLFHDQVRRTLALYEKRQTE